MVIDKNKSYKEQTEDVKQWLDSHIDMTAKPIKQDNLGRPAVYNFTVTDDNGVTYIIEITNVYQSDRSWALQSQIINLIPV